MLTQVTTTQRFQDVAAEKFATVKLYGKGAVPRVIGEGKTPAPFVGTRLAAGNVVYSRIDARHGAFAIVDERLEGAVVSKDFPQFAIRSEKVDRRYLKWILTSPDFYGRIQAMSFGATNRQRMSEAAFLTMSVPLPDVEGQRRIAAILDQADELRAKRRRTLALLDELSAEVLASIDHRKQVPLAQHLQFLTSGSRGWARYYADEGTPFLRIQNVGKDKLTTSDLVHVDAPPSAEADRTRVEAGDVLLSITADLGRSAVVTSDLAGANVSQHLALLRLKGIAPRFVSAYLSSPTGVRQLMKMNRGATKQGLNFDDVRSIRIPSLAGGEQRDLVGRLEAIAVSASRAEAHLAHLDELFASLRHRAFTGQL